MSLIIRKLVTMSETTYVDGERPAATPLKMIGAAAVIRNPWAGMGFVEDLNPILFEFAAELGTKISALVIEQAGSGDAIEAYGKSAVVGSNVEIEHGRAIIHQLRFGNRYREAVGAKSYLLSTNTRGGLGAPIHIPLQHKHDDWRRSHFLTVQMSIADAPGPDEIVIALGAATAGSPHHRIGDRFQDIKDMQAEASI